MLLHGRLSAPSIRRLNTTEVTEHVSKNSVLPIITSYYYSPLTSRTGQSVVIVLNDTSECTYTQSLLTDIIDFYQSTSVASAYIAECRRT